MDMRTSEHLGENGVLNDGEACNGDDGTSESFESGVKDIIEWLNGQLPDLNVPAECSFEDLRVCLRDGTALCHLLNTLSPGAVEMGGNAEPDRVTIERFLSSLENFGLPGFDVSDLEQGSMVKVLECLQELKSNFSCTTDRETLRNHVRKRWNVPEVDGLDGTDRSLVDSQHSGRFGPEKRKNSWESKFQTVLHSTALSGNLGPDVKVSELMKWSSLDKAPMQLLFSMVERVLDESLERKSAHVPHRVACLLKRLVREIERRMSSQADKIKNQNNICKVREGKYQSKVKALETIAVGAAEESEAFPYCCLDFLCIYK